MPPASMTALRACPPWALAGTILAGGAVWAVAFAWRPGNFWLLMSGGVGALAVLALRVRGSSLRAEGVRPGDLGVGAASAAFLYAIFALGRTLIVRAYPGAASEIGRMYALRAQAPGWAIALALICVIAPGEELFWRGLVQWELVRRLGPRPGWAAATAIYSAVHLAAANTMLVPAAAAAGGLWGLLYLRTGRIAPVVASHILWDLAVFLAFPLG